MVIIHHSSQILQVLNLDKNDNAVCLIKRREKLNAHGYNFITQNWHPYKLVGVSFQFFWSIVIWPIDVCLIVAPYFKFHQRISLFLCVCQFNSTKVGLHGQFEERILPCDFVCCLFVHWGLYKFHYWRTKRKRGKNADNKVVQQNRNAKSDV